MFNNCEHYQQQMQPLYGLSLVQVRTIITHLRSTPLNKKHHESNEISSISQQCGLPNKM